VGRLAGKVAIISGAARGTGEATARLFAAEGARVVVADILTERGQSVAQELGDAALFVQLDVTSEVSWQRAIEQTTQHFGTLNVLVNNAGVLHMAALCDTAVADFERVVAVNQKGVFLGMKTAAPVLQAAGGGSIVNVASIDGMKGGNGLVAYGGSKWAVRGMTRVAALELGKHGIRVNAVCPESGSPEMIRPFLPEGIDPELAVGFRHNLLSYQRNRTTSDRIRDITNAILFLASDESLSCTGTDLLLDSGILAGKIAKGAPGS
jgi:3alpha(or 20beta)-hydroxysteroid dehydrogenase